MAATTPTRSTSTADSSAPDDETPHWSEKYADEFIKVIDKIRSMSVDRVTMAAKVLVYGLFGAIAGTFVAISLAIVLVRLLVIFTSIEKLPGDGEQVWAAHLLVGLFFCLAGAIAWRFRPQLDI
jgi:hypothetical protein